MHKEQDDNLMVLQGTRYIDIYNPNTKENASFVVTPEKFIKMKNYIMTVPLWLYGLQEFFIESLVVLR